MYACTRSGDEAGPVVGVAVGLLAGGDEFEGGVGVGGAPGGFDATLAVGAGCCTGA